MRPRRPIDLLPLIMAVLLPLLWVAAISSPAAAGPARPSFSRLTRPLLVLSKRLEKALFSIDGTPTRKGRLSAIKVQIRGTTETVTTADAGKTSEEAGPGDRRPTPTIIAARTDYAKEPLPAGAPRIEVSASGTFVAKTDGKELASFDKNQRPTIGYSNNRYYLVEKDQTIVVSDKPIEFQPKASGTALSLPGYTDMNWNNTVNLNWFRGSIEMVYSSISHRLWAVNELYLEDYLRGIAEAKHDASEEHLKVMAIVSRSYAVHHLANGGRHQGEPFQLKNSRNGNGDDQVYRGYMAEQRQPRIAQAAADTAGVVVTFEGRPVITPYSSRPSGRTRSPAEAGWNVDWPWVISVPDPDTAGMTRVGHGVGLSGYGSRARAERGETAAQILAYYFPGTTLGQAATANQKVRVSIFSN